ncbi:MAG TPA: condensation domain-containing protein, partial [Blastocatellia bacterium]|nr:condensation domain-containing protein [Blastocatellia bacterium]
MSQAVSTLAHLPLEQLRALARRLGDKSGDNASARIGPRDPSSSPPPLSYAQERLWVMDQIEPAGGAYNIASAVRYEGEVSPAAVEASINDVIRRHEVLRTTFRLDGEAPVQEIAEQAPLGLALVDLSGLPAHASEGEARQMALEQACRPFDLARGPLILATLLRLHSNERILVVSVHHTVFDGWCSHIFSREFDAIHEAFVNGEPSLLAELDIQYADFAVWQREWLQGDRLQKLVWYWKKQLADPGVLNLPTDFARPAVSTYRGSRQSLVLPRAVSRGIEQLSHKLGITQFMVMLAAFKTLLFRISGQGDILTGAPIANRMRVELEGLIGCFVNTLVFRADLSGGPRFEDLCARVSEMCRQAYAHQDLPFEKLVDEINPAREMSRNPLFQAVFNYNNTPTPFQMNDDTSGKINDGMINAGTAVFELTLTVDPADPVTMNRDQMNCVLEYKTDLFDAVTIKRMLGQLALLLEGVVANPAMRLTDLPMLSSAQQHQQLIEWNDTVAGQNHTFKVHHQFELRASERPDAIALQFGDEQLSYGALNHRANQMGNYLRARGVVREDLIAVCLHRSIEWVEAILGVVKAGAAYVPLDPDSPSERLQYMMEGVRILITAGKGNRPTANSGIGIVNIDRDRQEIYRQPSYNPWNETKDSSLVYVIYTSGSTGRPKGVGIEHAGLMNLVAWHLREYSVSHKDRATQVAQVSFDASVWEMWPYLAGGARLEIAAQETKTDPSRLVKWTELRGITISFLPTPLAEAVLGQKGGPASQLKVLLTGGDRLRQGKQKGQRFRLVNHYGPTENTVVATSATVDENGPAAPPIGRPIMNTRVYVLDAQRQPVAIGVPG